MLIESGNTAFPAVGVEGFALIFGSLMSLAHEANNSPRAITRIDNVRRFMLVSLEE
jgi:hypothetical protein